MGNIKQDMKRLDNIANMYHKTSGAIKEMWKKKWYDLLKDISMRLEREKNKLCM